MGISRISHGDGGVALVARIVLKVWRNDAPGASGKNFGAVQQNGFKAEKRCHLLDPVVGGFVTGECHLVSRAGQLAFIAAMDMLAQKGAKRWV